ncbi:MAG: hypothetical protein DHS20C20_23280 [Ardenticatenaceae bacterium]|nr:MAG: hypothetical protein DHS20C20_23280 [Ardenticatenaceae bacterium]
MFQFQSIRKFVPVLTVLVATAVTIAQSEAGSALLTGIQILVLRQPQGF